jgi:iron complex transport system substrate-binding protein
LQHLGCQADVITIDPMTLEDVLESIDVLGAATANHIRASELVDELRDRLRAIEATVRGRARPRIAVLEWTDPLFCAGHWVPDLVEAAGADSVLGASGERSYQIDAAAVAAARPDIVVVAPCGYRLDGAVELATALHKSNALPERAELWAVDADAMFVRPGPRLVDGVETLAGIAHPEAVPLPAGAAARIGELAS